MKFDERLDRTQQAIELALHDSHGYHNLRRGDCWLPLRVYFGEADCCVTASFGPGFGFRTELLIGVPADWLETVLLPGLDLVNGAVVLQALPLAWIDNVVGAEQAWTAKTMLQETDSEGVYAADQVIVRYGGETNRGNTGEQAMEWCLLKIRERLGI